MIETEFFILSPEHFAEFSAEASIEGVSIDYYLMEFVDVIEELISE